MGPMEKMFCKLNSEKISMIHLVFPTVKVQICYFYSSLFVNFVIVQAPLATLELHVDDEGDSAHSFAKEMKAQIKSYFSSLSTGWPSSSAPSTGLSSHRRRCQWSLVRAYLESKFYVGNGKYSSKNILRCCILIRCQHISSSSP